tara:strand:+ start:970 stop:1110 length:141 start_codon:yes stop_codon:yes gene_type:complete
MTARPFHEINAVKGNERDRTEYHRGNVREPWQEIEEKMPEGDATAQ